ncbi:MAG TPA: LytTR family DNA-binding domain-containing protein, partial [Mucilaginibacter sp.]
IFLDIQMPRQTGLDFLKEQHIFQQVIFITAHAEFAIEGFELEATDYLMKPVTYERFLKACQKAHAKVTGSETIKGLKERPDFIYVKSDQRFEKIRLSDILYVEAMLNYVHIVLAGRKYTIYSSLKAIEEQLPKNQFLRIHKSFLVALSHINAADQHSLRIADRELPIGRSHKKNVLRAALDLQNHDV